MNLFHKIKTDLDFIEVMEFYIGPLKSIGTDTYTTEEDLCPIHGGSGCFRLKADGENSIVNCFGNCDHDDWPVDVIEFVRIYKKLETPAEAAYLIAKDFKIKRPEVSPVQKAFNIAAQYYRDLYVLNTKKYPCLGSRTPAEYQRDVRFHKDTSLDQVGIGWSDGRLHEHLEMEGITKEEAISTGLVVEKRGRVYDFLPSDAFIYPHIWGGKVSRFTFKRIKGTPYQMKKAHWINEVEFLAVGRGEPVAIVEGENDLVSLLDNDWQGTVLCTNGQLSKSQLEWIANNPADYHTFWDADPAGDKYADKMWKIHILGRIPKLTQWAIPEGDIDNYLQDYDLKDLKATEPPAREDIVSVLEKNGPEIVMENGCYKVVKMTNDGETEVRVPISNFTIDLLYVKVQHEERSRVIRIRRNDGRKSGPVIVNSEAKVSLRHWKILVANAVDADFCGNETDLGAMWNFVYANQKEAVVEVPEHVGDLEGDGWLFGNQYMSLDGDVKGDSDNIMWFNSDKTHGVAPKSLTMALGSTRQSGDIPKVWKGDHTEEVIEEVLENLNKVLKDPGLVLTIMGWLRSCAYSMPLFYDAKMKFFPFLLLWGRHGRGKSTLANWMLSVYDMADKGTTTVGQLRSGVGIERKLAYYRGLPYCIDELRADRQASEYSRTWRGWYNRSSRVKGTRKSEEVIQVPLNACLFFSGQDTFADPAMRSRCIPCKFPMNAGDTYGYTWLEDAASDGLLQTIGYHWIREAMAVDINDVKTSMDEYKAILKKEVPMGVPGRSIGNYAMIGHFAKDMAAKYFPKFDYEAWLVASMMDEHIEALENDMTAHFWDGLAGLQVGDHPKINGNHVTVKDHKLYVWYAEVFKLVANNNRADSRESFSKGAVRDALVEESYFCGNHTLRLGATGAPRRCLVFDLKHKDAPQEMTAVAETAKNSF